MAYFEMSRLALKWALTKPPTSRYPFEPRRALTGSRGRLIFTKDNCVYCTVCAKKCPTGALLVTPVLNLLFRPITIAGATHLIAQLEREAAREDGGEPGEPRP